MDKQNSYAKMSEEDIFLLKQKRHNPTDFRSIKINSDRIDFDLSCEHVEQLIKNNLHFFNGVNSYNFNIFEFSKAVGRNMQMPFMATSLLK